MTWLGDTEAKRSARRVPYRLLDPVEQVGDPAAQNMLIQGDNPDEIFGRKNRIASVFGKRAIALDGCKAIFLTAGQPIDTCESCPALHDSEDPIPGRGFAKALRRD